MAQKNKCQWCRKFRRKKRKIVPKIRENRVRVKVSSRNDLIKGVTTSNKDRKKHIFSYYWEYMRLCGIRYDLDNWNALSILRTVTFCITFLLSSLYAMGDLKYTGIDIFTKGTLLIAIQICYNLVEITIKFAFTCVLWRSKKITFLVEQLESRDNLLPASLLWRMKTSAVIITASAFVLPVATNAVDMLISGDVLEYLKSRSIKPLHYVLVWSVSGEGEFYVWLNENCTNTTKVVVGVLGIGLQTIGLLHAAFIMNLMATSGLTMFYMAKTFKKEIQTPPSRILLRRRKISPLIWNHYKLLRETSDACQTEFEVLFNLIHIETLFRCAFLLCSLVKNPGGIKIPFFVYEIVRRGVIYNVLEKIPDIKLHFLNWICKNYGQPTHIEIGTDGEIATAVLLTEVKENSVGIPGGSEIVTKALNISMFNVVVQNFILLMNLMVEGQNEESSENSFRNITEQLQDLYASQQETAASIQSQLNKLLASHNGRLRC